MDNKTPPDAASKPPPAPAPQTPPDTPPIRLDPTRYGDWELNGKCVDF